MLIQSIAASKKRVVTCMISRCMCLVPNTRTARRPFPGRTAGAATVSAALATTAVGSSASDATATATTSSPAAWW